MWQCCKRRKNNLMAEEVKYHYRKTHFIPASATDLPCDKPHFIPASATDLHCVISLITLIQFYSWPTRTASVPNSVKTWMSN